MGCSCCSNEIAKDNSFFENIRKKRIKQYAHNNNSSTSKLRIDTIGSVNSINFNGVLNITYKNTNPDNSNKRDSENRLITDSSDSYISKRITRNNNTNKNIINNFNTEPIIEEIQKTNYNIISIKKKRKEKYRSYTEKFK